MNLAATANQAKELLEQRRAKGAYAAVGDARNTLGSKQHEYKTVAQNLPVMILQNGLGQTVAFMMSKAEGKEKSAHGMVLGKLAEWLIDKRGILDNPGGKPTERLMCALLKVSRDRWLRAQEEALAFSVWLKRFAEALIAKPQSGEDAARRERHGQAEAAE